MRVLSVVLASALIIGTSATTCVRTTRVVLTPSPHTYPHDSLTRLAIFVLDSVATVRGLEPLPPRPPCLYKPCDQPWLAGYGGDPFVYMYPDSETAQLVIHIYNHRNDPTSPVIDSLRQALTRAYETRFDPGQVAVCGGGGRCPGDDPPLTLARKVLAVAVLGLVAVGLWELR